MNILQIANQTLNYEIEGLNALKGILNENFIKICNEIADCKGRVIISGVGKSGHIGKKISSTMSSIGIPSFFLHPSEASHGDLGMICENDVIILISNSGETKEFSHLIAFLQNEKMVSIAITRSEFSTLSNACKYKLVMPNVAEAVSYGAPTTSTTQTLAVGDILSVCASQIKGFTEINYAKIHPGGKLGLSLITVSKVMRKNEDASICEENVTVKELVSFMKSGIVMISDKSGKLAGVVTDGDIRRGILKFENISTLTAKEIMTKTPKTLLESEMLIKAVEIFNEHKVGAIIIVNKDGKITGLLDRKDIAF